jgi:hypothetical protein
MTDGLRLHGLFKGFRLSTPSTVTGRDVHGYRTCSMLMTKVLFLTGIQRIRIGDAVYKVVLVGYTLKYGQ